MKQRNLPEVIEAGRRGHCKQGRLFLTFDDGPDPLFTPHILDLLAKAEERATFFLVAQAAVRYPALVRRIAGEGHEVANHTWSHRHPWVISSVVARREVSDASAVLADLLGRAPRYFRPPYGRLRRCMVEQARRLGQVAVLWTLSGIDWGPLGRAAWIVRRLRTARAGDIILLHDGRMKINRPQETVKALGVLLAELRRQGLRSSPLDIME